MAEAYRDESALSLDRAYIIGDKCHNSKGGAETRLVESIFPIFKIIGARQSFAEINRAGNSEAVGIRLLVRRFRALLQVTTVVRCGTFRRMCEITAIQAFAPTGAETRTVHTHYTYCS